MFERKIQGHDADPDVTHAPDVRDMLTTDDIVARVQRRPRLPMRRLLLWAGFGLGLFVVLMICIATVRHERAAWAHLEEQVDRQAALQRPAAAPPMAPVSGLPTAVTVRMSHLGSIYIDGRFVGMQRKLLIDLPQGEHVLLVRFGGHTHTRALHVGVLSGVVHCDRHKGCGPFKLHAKH